MQSDLEDRMQIDDLINGWMHRDLGQWDQLRDLFHPDGIIEVTWFEGAFSDFVDGSMRMGESDFRTKHLIGKPVVLFNGPKAVAETNAMIIGENVRLGLGCSIHNRFYDRIEKRDGAWKMSQRQVVYDMGTFTFPEGLLDIDRRIVQKYPREYAALAYLLEQSGFPVEKVLATRGSALEDAMKSDAMAWLGS